VYSSAAVHSGVRELKFSSVEFVRCEQAFAVEARKSLQVTDKFRSPANRAVVHRRFRPSHPLQEDSSDLGTCCCPGQDTINTTQQGRQLVHDAAVRCFGSDTPPLGMTFTHKHGNTQRCVTLPEEN